jgi:hypothetical protein
MVHSLTQLINQFKNWLTTHNIKARIIAWFRLDNLKAVIAVLTGIAGLITYCFSLFGNPIEKDGKPREKVHNENGQSFSVVVYTHGINGRQNVVALKETKLIADFGGRRDVAKIAENGQNTFNEVDAQYRDTRIGIGLQGTEGYVLRFPDSTYLLDGSPIYLAVQTSCRFCKLAGVVRSQNAFIPNAVVSTGAFVDTTDANGYFEINLPPEKEQTEYPVTVRLKDKIVWDKFITPNPKQAAEILVEHK